YNCGPTVYSYAHIGNARAAVAADVLFRVLCHIYGEDAVVYARNITDVDDKIIAASQEEGVPISDITEKYARIYNEDLAALNCLPPTYQPKATDHISDMVKLIQDLIDKGHAYVSDGHVFFDVSTYEGYGALSGNTLDNLRGGDRVGEGEVARKRNAADFVLWKPELDGVGWDAALGPDGANLRGRPGWHIECSAMIRAKLGKTIDIHCGGIDLKFPHHENEIAQSCCGNGTDEFARFWVHNEFLNMGKDKMSKSLGNVTLVHDLLKEWDGEVIRFELIGTKYRNQLIWEKSGLTATKNLLDRLYRMKSDWLTSKSNVGNEPDTIFLEAVANDLNIPDALRVLMERIAETTDQLRENSISKEEGIIVFGKIIASLNLIGFLQRDPEDWFRGNASADESAEFDALAAARHAARQAKDWAEADRIRDEGKARGIVFEDGPDGTSWRKA
ncbi:MAG: cysteine--tRNA ligase, partial [Pseudomonadota bacterium]